MDGKEAVNEIAKACGGTIKEMHRLPDGSGFATMSIPLREDHWIYKRHTNEPPMTLRIGTEELLSPETLFSVNKLPAVIDRELLAEKIREVGKYAVRCATMNGEDMDFDPDALLQNLVVGFLGYWTDDGLSHID